MFEKDAFQQRGQALEDEFFHRVDEKLRAQLREKMQREEAKQQLATVTHFTSDALLDHLVEAGFEPASLAALALAPTVMVAWADGEVTPKERQAVLSGALHHGVDRTPAAFHLIEGWLHDRPSESVWTLWKEYATQVYAKMEPVSRKLLAREILDLATKVAKASGGPRGTGKISAAEQLILDEIEAVSNQQA